jgi:hypothetical protein
VQLELFQGGHLPLFRARAALEEGDLRRAHEELGNAAAGPTADRLARLEGLLLGPGESLGPPPDRVHTIFEQAFATAPNPTRDPIGAPIWFRLYAAHVVAALAPTPARRFRGWCAVHFELAAGRLRPALAGAERLISEAAPAGWAWLEAARAAHANGDAARANRWTLAACLSSCEALEPAPPQLAPTGRGELDAPESALPELPSEVENLWTEAFVLGLSEPVCAWVPSLGVLDGIFLVVNLRSAEVAQAAAFDLDQPAPPDEPASRSFLRALVAAREASARETRAAGRCGALELRARAAMKRANPALFERYLAALGLYR